jgi:sugar O-acyltransferase (sialic acid O-acetyltransferase NeuD family)
MSKKVILIGGFCEIIELCEDNYFAIAGIIDNMNVGEYMGYPIIGTDRDAPSLYPDFKDIPLIITPDLPLIRKRLFDCYGALNYKFSSLISQDARISKSALIGHGTIIQNGVNISSEAEIGRFVKINTNANIMHNSKIGNFTTIAPNAVILGKVTIGNECYIGANATILPNINICDNVVIGAGAVVTRSIEKPNATYVGIPARLLNK